MNTNPEQMNTYFTKIKMKAENIQIKTNSNYW